MTSNEKVAQLVREWTTREPKGIEDSMMLLVAQQLGPKLIAKLPDDPAELDELIAEIAGKVLSLRGDDAEPIALERRDTPELAPEPAQ